MQEVLVQVEHFTSDTSSLGDWIASKIQEKHSKVASCFAL